MADDNEKIAAKQRSLDNIKPHEWKPGQSGNPKGAPKCKTNLYRYFCEYMEMSFEAVQALIKDKNAQKQLSMSQVAALALCAKVGKGEWPQQKEVIERDEGKVPQKTELSGTDGEPIKFYRGIEPEKM